CASGGTAVDMGGSGGGCASTGESMVNSTHDSRFTVLLPDEREGWHEHVSRLLGPQGVETLLARSGREALDLIESHPIHLAVLDVRMPQLGGLQVVKLM